MNYSDNKAFSPTVPNLQLVWDATSLTALKECPFKYYLSIICGYEPRAMNIHLTFGIAYHSALEEFDRQVATGAAREDALRAAIRTGLVAVHGIPEDNYKNAHTLTRSVVWYVDHYEQDAQRTVVLDNGRPAVELHFQFAVEADTGGGEQFQLCGHLDKISSIGDEEFILDRKTTKYTLGTGYFSKYALDVQMTLYSIAGKIVFARPVTGILIDAVQLAVSFSRFGRNIAHRTADQLEEWLDDLPHWLAQAESYALKNNWPMNDSACNHYGGCKFRDICSKSPKVRGTFLEANFQRRVWDPTQERGV